MAARMSAAKVQGFRKGGLVDWKIRQSAIYGLRSTLTLTLLRCLQSQAVGGLYNSISTPMLYSSEDGDLSGQDALLLRPIL